MDEYNLENYIGESWEGKLYQGTLPTRSILKNLGAKWLLLVLI